MSKKIVHNVSKSVQWVDLAFFWRAVLRIVKSDFNSLPETNWSIRLAIIAAAVDVAGLPSLQKKCSTRHSLGEEPRIVSIMELEITDLPAPIVVAIVSYITSPLR